MNLIRPNGDGTKPLVQRSAIFSVILGTFLVVAMELLPLIENDHIRNAARVGILYVGSAMGVVFGTKSKQA